MFIHTQLRIAPRYVNKNDKVYFAGRYHALVNDVNLNVKFTYHVMYKCFRKAKTACMYVNQIYPCNS